MENKNPPDMPKYIRELMQPTPSGVSKLLAAWSGLSHETQILILSELDKTGIPAYLAEKIRRNALYSDNAYIRYLAAREFNFSSDCSDEEKLLKEKIENDPVPLVKYSLLEDSSGISAIFDDSFKDADTFFALPHEARLAKIRLVDRNGEKIAALLSQAADIHLKDGTVSEIELYEILTDYLAKPEFHEKYTNTSVTYDGWGEYTKGKDIESLWKLIPKLPEGISHILIENLPEASGLKSEIPEDVINSMTDHQLETLLYRKDIGLEKLRKKLFWEAGEDRERIKSAAVSFNFKMEYDEFAKILAKPPKERVSILKVLGMIASQLPLCFYDAIHDALFASNVSPLGNDFEDAIFARDALERRIEELEGWQRAKELTELRLYRLANSAIPWDSKKEGYAPTGELEFLSEKVVPDDTWATFMAFSETWSRRPSQGKDQDKHLPRIYEIEENDWQEEEPDADSEPSADTKLMNRMNEKSSEVQNFIIQKKKKFLKEKLLPKERSTSYSQYNTILKQIADKISEYSIEMNEDEDDFEYRLYDAFEIVDDIKMAFESQSQSELEEQIEDKYLEEKPIRKEDHIVWYHGNVQGALYEGYESKHAIEVDKDWLTDQTIKYLQRPWMENELIEWILVDSLLFGELVGYGESIKQYSPKGLLNLNENYYTTKGNIKEMEKINIKEYLEKLGYKFAGFFVLPLFIAIYSYREFSKEYAILGAVIYFSTFTLFLLIRKVFRLLTKRGKDRETAIYKSINLQGAMSEVYDILKAGTISPEYLREKLYETSKMGAIWPSAVFMIVDHAINRNPAMWNSPKSLEYDKY